MSKNDKQKKQTSIEVRLDTMEYLKKLKKGGVEGNQYGFPSVGAVIDYLCDQHKNKGG